MCDLDHSQGRWEGASLHLKSCGRSPAVFHRQRLGGTGQREEAQAAYDAGQTLSPSNVPSARVHHNCEGYQMQQEVEPQVQPFDPVELRNFVRGKLGEAVEAYFIKAGRPLAPVTVPKVVATVLSTYDLGDYIIDQNPYAFPNQLDLPAIPSDPVSETRRVRKTGVLRDNHAYSPPANPQLPTTSPVPGGFVFDFVYPDLPSLDDGDGTTPGETPVGASGGDAGSLNKKEVYPHNVIKIIRFRYNTTNRDDPTTGIAPPAYLLVMYSGGDA